MRICLILISISLLLYSCGSFQPIQPQISEKFAPLEQATGTIRIPVNFNLAPIFKQVDGSLDYEFKGDKQQCEDVSFSYVFKRNELKFDGKSNSIFSNIQGAYSIKANYCAKCSGAFGMDPFCLTPRLFVSCGVNEPLRKIQLQFETKLQIDQDYRLNGKSQLKELKSIDPCEFTFVRYDASKLIENEISKALKDVEKRMDLELKKINLKPTVEKAWKELQEGISIPEIGYLYFQPQSIGLSEFVFDKSSLSTVLELGVKPQILSDEKNETPSSLPNLQKSNLKDGLEVPILLSLRYDSLNQLINRNMGAMPLALGKKEIVINKIELLGPSLNKTIIKVEFAGDKEGVLYLLGVPVFLEGGKKVAIQQVEFDLDTKDLMLKSAKWLFRDEISKKIEEKLIFSIDEQVKMAKTKLGEQLNSTSLLPNGQKMKMSGQINELEPKQIQPSESHLQVSVFLGGKLSIKVD